MFPVLRMLQGLLRVLRRHYLLPLRDVLLNALLPLTPAHSLYPSLHDHDFCNTATSTNMYSDESADVEIGWHIDVS